MLLLIIIAASLLTALYKRYIPVAGVKQYDAAPAETDSIQILDVRDYNQSSHNPIPQALNLPVAYMNRNWHELSGIRIHVVASTKLEKNMSIRILKRKGYEVAGFTLTEQQSPPKQNNGKGYCYGI
ncbi:hypothetical protein D3H55_09425 [Bacillus salacetis]|uniref:Rhodanese-like domain-containing protein n=1 Tax=Bacillus salacetis TaxID=2315464 RepID=A0A3A1R4D8_9BACI|nr:hypothetical protein [Bacillus salacetis]RIW34721.1 hypothetical protein D3H55_09425 [Bacillus salacetis]